MEWIITYEFYPMRGLYRDTVVAESQEKAIEFLQSINNQKIKIVNIYDSKVLGEEGSVNI